MKMVVLGEVDLDGDSVSLLYLSVSYALACDKSVHFYFNSCSLLS
jgi:hypothetical protein